MSIPHFKTRCDPIPFKKIHLFIFH